MFQPGLLPAVIISILFSFFTISAAVDSAFHCYLLFGQSNMAGGCNRPGGPPEAVDIRDEDCDTSGRIKILAFTSCQDTSGPCGYRMNREKNKWYTAYPPYHDCDEGIGIADYFGKVLIDSLRDDITIGFIPCALSGKSINVFKKGSRTVVEDWCQKDLAAAKRDAYSWMVERCNIARETGIIKGILFHQGETDNGQLWWVDTVKKVFNDLKKDCNLDKNIPILVGELLQETDSSSLYQPCCSQHNPLVTLLASQYPNCFIVSSDGLFMRTGDTKWKAHFTCEAARELGKRYAMKLLEVAGPDYLPR